MMCKTKGCEITEQTHKTIFNKGLENGFCIVCKPISKKHIENFQYKLSENDIIPEIMDLQYGEGFIIRKY